MVASLAVVVVVVVVVVIVAATYELLDEDVTATVRDGRGVLLAVEA